MAGTWTAPACLTSPLAAKIIHHLVICPNCYQSEIHFSICIAHVRSSSKYSKAGPWNFEILRALCFPVAPELLLTYLKMLHDVAPVHLNSLISECGPTPFYLFITSRLAEDFFWLSATPPEGQAGIRCMPVFWKFTTPGFACYFWLLKTLFLQLVCGRTQSILALLCQKNKEQNKGKKTPILSLKKTNPYQDISHYTIFVY